MKTITSIILIIILIGIGLIGWKMAPKNSMGSIPVLSGPTSVTQWVNSTSTATASDLEILGAGDFDVYAKICTMATTTYANGGEIVTYLVSTSSDVSTLQASIGPYATPDASKPASGNLEYYNRCVIFENNSLTNRAIYAMATTTQGLERTSFYVQIIYQ